MTAGRDVEIDGRGTSRSRAATPKKAWRSSLPAAQPVKAWPNFTTPTSSDPSPILARQPARLEKMPTGALTIQSRANRELESALGRELLARKDASAQSEQADQAIESF